MSQGRASPGTPQDWLARAKGDLALARLPLPQNAFYEDLCFHAQQAAEKALKAVYQHHGWTFRYTHDLEELVTGLESKGLILFAYQNGKIGSSPQSLTRCPTCGASYYLEPAYAGPEPDPPTPPAPLMTIVQVGGPL